MYFAVMYLMLCMQALQDFCDIEIQKEKMDELKFKFFNYWEIISIVQQ